MEDAVISPACLMLPLTITQPSSPSENDAKAFKNNVISYMHCLYCPVKMTQYNLAHLDGFVLMQIYECLVSIA